MRWSIIGVNSCTLCGSKESLVEHHISYNPPKKIIVCQKCHEEIHGNVPVASDLSLKMRQYDMIVKLSVMVKNWLQAYKRTFGLNPISLELKRIQKKKETILKDVKGMLKEELRKVEHIKGLGARYLAGILAYAHPNRFSSLRKFLAYCGYKESAKVTGRYNRKVCSMVNRVVRELIIHKDENYYPLYLKIKKDLAERHPNYSKRKIDAMARNRVGTFLLKELYILFKDKTLIRLAPMSKRKKGDDPTMVELRERLARVETHLEWVKKKLESVDQRSWWILGSVVVLGVVAILIAVLK